MLATTVPVFSGRGNGDNLLFFSLEKGILIREWIRALSAEWATGDPWRTRGFAARNAVKHGLMFLSRIPKSW